MDLVASSWFKNVSQTKKSSDSSTVSEVTLFTKILAQSDSVNSPNTS